MYTCTSWVRHLKCSLCLLALPKESPAYIVRAFLPRSLQRKKSYSPIHQKSSFVFPKTLTLYWAPKDFKSSSIIGECLFARVNNFTSSMHDFSPSNKFKTSILTLQWSVLLGPVQTSNFTCAEPNTYLGRPKLLSSTVDSDGRTLHVPNLIRGEKKYHPYCLK